LQGGRLISKWTGKCDFYDDCEMIHNPQEIIEKSKIYLGDARVMIKEEKDLIPYYTHLVAMASYNKEYGNVICLSRESFIDREEKEFLSWKIQDVITTFRKAKREKVEVTLDYLKKQKYYWGHGEDVVYSAIIDKIKNNMDLIKVHLPKDYRECNYFISEWLIPNYFNDIHDSMHNRYREEFIKFAHENGYRNFNEDGIYHPIIWKMCASIDEYNRMNEKYGGKK
jgi:phenylpyruvate tautomerase PptA (4-oxalocrotonate tautomerase family)